jgi:hypothetical protein
MSDKKARTLKQAKQLAKDLGMELPAAKPSASELGRHQVMRVISFAQANGFVINPTGYGYYIDGFNTFRHCPCDQSRPECPCKEAIDEVSTHGKCKCQLFWKDYNVYLKEKVG